LQPSNSILRTDRFVVVALETGKLLDTWALNL
jgi:hypothetical protein